MSSPDYCPSDALRYAKLRGSHPHFLTCHAPCIVRTDPWAVQRIEKDTAKVSLRFSLYIQRSRPTCLEENSRAASQLEEAVRLQQMSAETNNNVVPLSEDCRLHSLMCRAKAAQVYG